MVAAADSSTTDQRYYGVAEGLVVEVNDDGQEGRVKLKFPWFDSNHVSDWCRVSQFYAGGGYGAFFVPEVDDEVLVAFIHGDIRQPIVVGGLYNGKDKPCTHRARNKDEKLIRTKSGHMIVLDDTSSEEKIVIVDKDEKRRIEINTTEQCITIQSTGGKIRLEANQIEIHAQQSLKLTSATIEATATGDMKLAGQPIHLN